MSKSGFSAEMKKIVLLLIFSENKNAQWIINPKVIEYITTLTEENKKCINLLAIGGH